MGLNLEQKRTVVSEVSAKIAGAQSIVLAENLGLGVEAATRLRVKARAEGVYLRVIKNTLARRAVQGTSFAVAADQMVGPLLYGISTDPVAAAKLLSDFAKTNEKLVIKGGALPNHMLDAKACWRLPVCRAETSCWPGFWARYKRRSRSLHARSMRYLVVSCVRLPRCAMRRK